MTEVIAKLNYLRISPRKIRLVANLIKGLDVNQAKAQLRFLTKKAAQPISKLLDSAIANASSFNLDKNNLYISKIIVNQGPSLKRWRPRAFGRATPILKRTSHISLVLEEKIPTEKIIKRRKISPEIKKEPKEEKPEIEKEIEKEKKITVKAKPVSPPRPYGTSSISKKRFFSRQTFGNIKKMFRRKSV